MGIEIGIIGVGWCGGIRAIAAADNPQVSRLHICDIKPDRLAEVKSLSKPASAVLALSRDPEETRRSRW